MKGAALTLGLWLVLSGGSVEIYAQQFDHSAVLIKPKALVEPDDVLTPQEAKGVRKGEPELRRGEFVMLSRPGPKRFGPARRVHPVP